MKEIKFQLDRRAMESFFEPIRCKADIIQLLMKTIKHILINFNFKQTDVAGSMVLVISKMSRLFYFTEQRQFSVGFPFRVNLVNDNINEIYTPEGVIIDNKLSSEILVLLSNLNNLTFNNEMLIIEALEEFDNPSKNLFNVFMHLLKAEDGYVRYDHDLVREDAKRHPLNHLDVFYENSNTFKLGISKQLKPIEFINILNISNDCHYLK